MRRGNAKSGFVSIYEFNLPEAEKNISINTFDSADEKWLQFVVANRRGESTDTDADMSKETNFLIFCIESYKAHRNLSGKAVIKLFKEYGVFDYIYEFYDVLHSTGHNYINNDIDIYLESRGAIIA